MPDSRIRQVVETQNAPQAIGPYSPGCQAGCFLFISGQLPLDPATGELVGGDIDQQTRTIMGNIGKICEAAGTELAQVVKTTIFVTDINDFARVNQVYGSFFQDNPPARSTVQVAALPLGANVEIEVVAALVES